jgi:hypothetical protein
MQAPPLANRAAQALARPWRDTPAARPAFSRLAVSRGPARLSIASKDLDFSWGTTAACYSFIMLLLWLSILAAGSRMDSFFRNAGPTLLPCLFFVRVTYVVVKKALVRQHTFSFAEDKWEVTCRRVFGLLSTRQYASGHTAHIVAARVAASGITASQLTTAIQILQQESAVNPGGPASHTHRIATVSTVYTAGATSVPLSLTEQEFIVAEVNRYLERVRGIPIPSCIENTLFVDQSGSAVLAPPPHADRLPVPPRVLPVFAGGAPFARPVALVPPVPLTGCRMSSILTEGGLGREGCTIVLQRNHLPIYSRFVSGLRMRCVWMWGIFLGICSSMHLYGGFWVFFAVGLLAGAVQLFYSVWTVDQLLLSEHDWVLKQHVLGRKVRRGGQWTYGLVVDSGPLSDLLGAQVQPPFVSTLCLAFMTRFALASASA